MNKNILLVEDDLDFGNILKQYIELNGFKIKVCRDGKEGLISFQKEKFDLCILDVMMPEMDGFTLSEKIKNINKNIPFIFLTAKTQKEDRIKGLKLGADDYICKPFEAEELLLRITNILRRTQGEKTKHIKIGNYTFNSEDYSLRNENYFKQLTAKESQLLIMLAENPEKIIKRSEILLRIWGENDYFLGRSMDVFISRLRKYLSLDKNLSIESIRGTGFLLKKTKK